MRRLIIGCGYLGCRVADLWREEGDRVKALTRTADRARILRDRGLHPLVGDVSQPGTLADLPSVDTVLYAVGYDRHAGLSKHEVYVQGLRHVLAAIPASVSRFVYVSSTSVYGQRQGEWVDETSECQPTSEGGSICLQAERLLRDQLQGRVPYQILRHSGLYGPGRLIARLSALRSREPLPGNPLGWLNLVHVDDAARAILLCSRRSTEAETLLVTDSEPFVRRRYYEALAALVGVPAPVFREEPEPRADLGKRCSNRRLCEAIGPWQTYPTIAEGLPHAVSATS